MTVPGLRLNIAAGRPTPRRILRALRIIHPLPTLLNVAATAALAFVAARGVPDATVLARMLVAMLCAQSAIGAVNDHADRDLDAAMKPWKPIPAGLVSPAAALWLAGALLFVAVGAGATLGSWSLLLLMLGIGCGLVYDVRLKRSRWSGLPFMVAIPTLPLWVWVTLGAWHDRLLWLVPLGALIGLSLHLANTLPDLAGDAAHGVQGLAHGLGDRRSKIVAWTSFAVALALSLALAPALAYDLAVYLPVLAAGSLALIASVWAGSQNSPSAQQFAFGVLGIGAAVVATGWLAAIA